MKYQIHTAVTAKADPRMNNQTVKELWHGFTLTCSKLSIESGTENIFMLGCCQIPDLPDGKEYALTPRIFQGSDPGCDPGDP